MNTGLPLRASQSTGRIHKNKEPGLNKKPGAQSTSNLPDIPKLKLSNKDKQLQAKVARNMVPTTDISKTVSPRGVDELENNQQMKASPQTIQPLVRPYGADLGVTSDQLNSGVTTNKEETPETNEIAPPPKLKTEVTKQSNPKINTMMENIKSIKTVEDVPNLDEETKAFLSHLNKNSALETKTDLFNITYQPINNESEFDKIARNFFKPKI
jgi:hypothetical protein